MRRAAAEVFATHDYRATTVARLAKAADVPVQTLNAAWGEQPIAGARVLRGRPVRWCRDPEDAARRFGGFAPGERLEELATLMAEVTGRAATGWRLLRGEETRVRLEWSCWPPRPFGDPAGRRLRATLPAWGGLHFAPNRQPWAHLVRVIDNLRSRLSRWSRPARAVISAPMSGVSPTLRPWGRTTTTAWMSRTTRRWGVPSR